MTDSTRWLDELPLGAPERELLRAGKAARPPVGAVDADWQALCLALGAATAAGSAAASSAALNTATAVKSASASAAVGKAAAVGAWGIGVKWFVAGLALGCGVVGARVVAGRVEWRTTSQGSAPAGTARTAATNVRASAGHAAPALRVPESPEETAVAVPVAAARPARPALRAEPEPSTRPAVTTAALAEQARELAEVKRLIDAGSAEEALRRLEANRQSGAPQALSEERDALNVQALVRAQRRPEARRMAQEFMRSYPQSPYIQAMRRVLAEQ